MRTGVMRTRRPGTLPHPVHPQTTGASDMRFEKLKPVWVRAGLLVATIVLFAWHVRADFDPTLGLVAYVVSLGLVAYEGWRKAAQQSNRGPTPAAARLGLATPPASRARRRDPNRPPGR